MSAEAVRFFSKVKRSENGCWIWIGGKQHKYGAFRISTKKTCRAHRWMYEWFWGAIPKGHVVMHTCDNPACVCPYHLVAGTQDENNRDCSRKGRSKHFKENGFFGEAHKMAKLTESEVKKIRQIGYSQNLKETADQFGVSRATICNILKRKVWKHI